MSAVLLRFEWPRSFCASFRLPVSAFTKLPAEGRKVWNPAESAESAADPTSDTALHAAACPAAAPTRQTDKTQSPQVVYGGVLSVQYERLPQNFSKWKRPNTVEIDLSRLDVRAETIRLLFVPFGQKQGRGVHLKDQKLADVAEFSRARKCQCRTGKPRRHAIGKLAEEVLTTLILIHDARPEAMHLSQDGWAAMIVAVARTRKFGRHSCGTRSPNRASAHFG